MRSDVDRARDQLLAGAALAGDQHRRGRCPAAAESARRRALIAALAERNPGSSGSSDAIDRRGRSTRGGRSRAAHSAKPWRATAAIIRRRRITGWPIGRGEATSAEARAVGVAAERLDDDACRGRRRCRAPPTRAMRARGVGIAAGGGDDAHVAAGQLDEDHARSRRRRLRAAPPRFRARAVPAAPPRRRSGARWHRRRRPAR